MVDDTMHMELSVANVDIERMIDYERGILKRLHVARDAIQFQIDMCNSRIATIKRADYEMSKRKKNAP